MSVRFDWKPKLAADGTLDFVDAPIAKHPGSDGGPIHDTGSDQTVHGASLLSPPTGEGKRLTKHVYKELANLDGTPWTYTAEHEGNLLVSFSDGFSRIAPAAEFSERVGEMHRIARKYGVDPSPDVLDANLRRLLDSVAERYAAPEDIFNAAGELIAGPSLILQDRFYEIWHEALYQLHKETGFDMTRIIAAASAISPGLDAQRNLHFAHDLARWIADEDKIVWAGAEAQALADTLRQNGKDILAPKWDKKLHEIPEGVEHGDLKPPPPEFLKDGSPGARFAQGKTLLAAADQIEAAGSIRLADLDAYSAAYALHGYRKAMGPAGELLGSAKDIYVEPPLGTAKGDPSGFDIPKGFDNYAKAIGALRGDITPLDALGDVKTRSFHNNILDPLNRLGRNDVTVDYHSVNFTTFSFGSDRNSSLMGTPTFEGVGFGVRPLIADAIRRMAVEYADVFPDGHVPSRIQEMAWAEWRRGGETGELSWTSFGGETHTDLPYTGKGKWRKTEQEGQ